MFLEVNDIGKVTTDDFTCCKTLRKIKPMKEVKFN